MLFKKGKQYICVSSKSPGYREGNVYYCFVNAKSQLCLRADDGYEDLVTNLVSAFKEVTPISERKFKVVE